MVYIYYEGPRRIGKARELRRIQTKAEQKLWYYLRNRRLEGFKIRRQHVLNEFILDFFCIEKGLCLEIDGPYHSDPSQRISDQRRDHELEDQGITVLRFTNDDVLFNLDVVLNVILKTLQDLPTCERKPLNQLPKRNIKK